MAFPNFLIIGAAKAATTSLYHYLRQHPDVYMSPVKEPAYFASTPAIGTRDAYERLFADATTERAIGEASPQYLNDARAPGRIAADVSHVRLIVSLRNPVDRAYSSYLGRLAGGTERRRVGDALRRGTYYFESSLYHAPLSRYVERFGRGCIKVMLFDDLVADPRAAVQDVCGFLGIARDYAFDLAERHGEAAAPRSIAANAAYWSMVDAIRARLPVRLRNTGLAASARRVFLRDPDPLPAPLRAQLREDFRADILQTEALIGRSLAHWLA